MTGVSRRALFRLDLGGIREADRRASLPAFAPVARAAAALAAPGPGDWVLVVGAGEGDAVAACAERGADVSACETSAALVARGRAAFDERIRWTRADPDALPYSDGAFDVVVAACDLGPHPSAARELVRVLVPGGRLVAGAWAPGAALDGLERRLADPRRTAGTDGDAAYVLLAGRRASSLS